MLHQFFFSWRHFVAILQHTPALVIRKQKYYCTSSSSFTCDHVLSLVKVAVFLLVCFCILRWLTFFPNRESSTQRDHIQPQTSQCVLHFSIFRQVRNKRCGYKLVVHKKSFLKVLGKLLNKNTCRISAVINSFSVHVEDQSCRLCFLIKLNLSVW